MKYTVTWRPSALQRLAKLWMAADDRAIITSASNAIDAQLATDPFAESESREGRTRIMVQLPLAVYYDVLEDDCLVSVWAVWQV